MAKAPNCSLHEVPKGLKNLYVNNTPRAVSIVLFFPKTDFASSDLTVPLSCIPEDMNIVFFCAYLNFTVRFKP
jgi:hypothetical protein